MLYQILYPLHRAYSALNVFRYISFRTLLAGLTALVISLWLGKPLIRKLSEMRIGQHIHKVADRRALIAADIADTVFQKGLGQRQNAFAGKGFPRPETQVFDFCLERPFRHARPLQKSCLRILPSIFCSVATKARRSSSGMP